MASEEEREKKLRELRRQKILNESKNRMSKIVGLQTENKAGDSGTNNIALQTEKNDKVHSHTEKIANSESANSQNFRTELTSDKWTPPPASSTEISSNVSVSSTTPTSSNHPVSESNSTTLLKPMSIHARTTQKRNRLTIQFSQLKRTLTILLITVMFFLLSILPTSQVLLSYFPLFLTVSIYHILRHAEQLHQMITRIFNREQPCNDSDTKLLSYASSAILFSKILRDVMEDFFTFVFFFITLNLFVSLNNPHSSTNHVHTEL